VPEGLPLAVMLSLAYSVKKMLADKNFVKKMTSCEVMGGANNICSDKTGTLTQNKMTLTMLWQGESLEINWSDDNKCQTPVSAMKNQDVAKLLAIAIACNSVGDINDAGATDLAMFKLIDAWGFKTPELRKEYPEGIRFQFDSTRKRMATIVEDSSLPYPKRMYTKGASEVILENCTHYLD
jgi:Ca2+ transporting ATPase